MSIVLVWIIGAIIAAVVAKNKKRNAAAWVIGCVLLSPLIILILLVLPPLASENIQVEKTKQCPHCAERIKAEAVVCKHCGRDIPKDEVQQASSPYEFK